MATAAAIITAFSADTGGRRPSLLLGNPGDRLLHGYFKLQMSSSYPTGGEHFDVTNQIEVIDSVWCNGTNPPDYIFVYDPVNKKIQAYNASDQSEVASATDLSAQIVSIVVWGQN